MFVGFPSWRSYFLQNEHHRSKNKISGEIFPGNKFLTENEFSSSPKHQKFIKNKFEVDVEVHFPGKTLLTVSIECNHASGSGGRTLQMFAWTTLSQKDFCNLHAQDLARQVFGLIPCLDLIKLRLFVSLHWALKSNILNILRVIRWNPHCSNIALKLSQGLIDL